MSESQYFAQRDQKNEEKLKAMLAAPGPYIMVCHVDPDAKTGD